MDMMILPLTPNGGPPLPGSTLWSQPPRHPISQEILCRFAEGWASPTERSAVLSHLLSGCRECSRALARQWQGVPTEEADYEGMFERSTERALEALATRAR